MPLEDDPEEVPGLPLVPVAGRVHLDQRRHPGVAVGHAHLQPDAPVVGDGQQRVDRVQFAAGVPRVVDPADAEAHLEAERGHVAEQPGDRDEVLGRHVQGQLAPVDDHLGHRLGEAAAAALQARGEFVGDLVEVGPVGTGGGGPARAADPQPAVSRGVAGGSGAEHAGPLDLLGQALLAGYRGRVRLAVRCVVAGHDRSPCWGSPWSTPTWGSPWSTLTCGSPWSAPTWGSPWSAPTWASPWSVTSRGSPWSVPCMPDPVPDRPMPAAGSAGTGGRAPSSVGGSSPRALSPMPVRPWPTTSGRRRSLACSSSSISALRLAPSFMFWILSCSL